jgi:peptidyl-prolyl cis-trans isomerase B (cyclophilin B)
MTNEPTRYGPGIVDPVTGLTIQDPALVYRPARATSGLAVAAFVLGVCGFGIVAVIFGHVALADIRKTDKDGRGLALAGLWLGYIVAAFWTLAILAIVIL